MISTITVLCMIIAFILLVLAIYNIYCFIDMHKLMKLTANEDINEVLDEHKSRGLFNLWVWVYKRKVKKITKSLPLRAISKLNSFGLKQVIKRLNHKIKIWWILVTAVLLTICILVSFIGISFIQLSMGVDSILSYYTLFSKDEDCVCYAKCSDNAEDDKKSVYELLFGPTEYEKIINHMTLKPEEYEYFFGLTYATKEESNTFSGLNNGDDGKAKSDFIRDHLNDAMVQDYKALVAQNSKFRAKDGLDRSKMSDDELRADLYQLLCDYKVNGRNPACNCKDYSSTLIDFKCMGMKHYVEGWSWESLWEDTTGDRDTSNTYGNIPGTATGEFAVTLNDGSYYWYHQSSETCKYNAYESNNGYVSNVYAGGLSYKTMAGRGCGIYSTAIALSNLLGEEITPYIVIRDVMGCTLQDSSGKKYFTSSSANGIAYTGDCTPAMSASKLAERINSVYGSKGIVADVINFDQQSVDSYLTSDDKYSYIINSWGGSGGASEFPWYTGGGHFMVVRGKDSSGLYYCFTSASTLYGSGHENIIKGMNAGITWSTMAKYARHSTALVISRSKSFYEIPNDNVGNIGELSNEQVYNALKDSEFKNKAKILSIVYGAAEPVYGKDFAIGMMANVYAEGSPGVVEYAFSQYHYWGFELPSGKTTIQNADDVNYLLNWDHTSKEKDSHGYQKGSVGIGICGWSFGRRINLLKEYQKYVKNYTTDEFTAVEISFMLAEYASSSYKSKVVDASLGKGCETAAKNICLYYEAPANKEAQAIKRAGYAKSIYSLLSGISESSGSGNSGGSSNNGGNSGGDSSTGNLSGTAAQQKIIDYALKHVGVKYVYGGNDINGGIDCSHFVLACYKNTGNPISVSAVNGRISTGFLSAGKKVNYSSVNDLQPGDVICYSGHVAIFIGNKETITITDTHGNKISVPPNSIVHASNSSAYTADQKGGGVKITSTWNYKTVLGVRRFL